MSTITDDGLLLAVYTDPDTVNTNHPFKQCALRHTEQRGDDIHCYTCGGEEDNGRHAPPYGDGAI